MMTAGTKKLALLSAVLLLFQGMPAGAAGCPTADLSLFSALAGRLDQDPVRPPGELMTANLLRADSPGDCRFVFHLIWLSDDGYLVHRFFDARTLASVEGVTTSRWHRYKPEEALHRNVIKIDPEAQIINWTEPE